MSDVLADDDGPDPIESAVWAAVSYAGHEGCPWTWSHESGLVRCTAHGNRVIAAVNPDRPGLVGYGDPLAIDRILREVEDQLQLLDAHLVPHASPLMDLQVAGIRLAIGMIARRFTPGRLPS